MFVCDDGVDKTGVLIGRATRCGEAVGCMWLGSGPCPRVCLLVAVLAVPKLQALVYDFLPSTTAVFSYAIGSRKLSANEQFFVGAQPI